MPTGTVKFFNQKNKFGFIKVDDSDLEIYVHIKDVVEMIDDADRVEFDIEAKTRGDQAVNVKKIE